MVRAIRRFLGFLYDFLIGDTWELFVGPIVALALVGAAVGMLGAAAAGALLFTLILVIAGISLTLALRGSA
jgi:hypothetical protein